MTGNSTYQPNIALFAALVWLVIVGQLLWLDWPQTARLLGDSDDAMRLVEVRALLDGRGWFDLHEPRLQPPLGYDTHWSRLVDGGLAGFFLIFRNFADAATAERLMRTVWPLIWLAPAIAGVITIAWRIGGRAASLVALLLLLFGLPAFLQFKPGRIDHHDVQITLALLTLAAAIWADRVRWTSWAAGLLSGVALAIGFEGLPFIVVAGASFAARYMIDRNHAASLARYGIAVAVSVMAVFFATVGHQFWTQTACDAMAINSAAPTTGCGLAFAIAGRWFADARPLVRGCAIAVAVGLATIGFILIEPRCLGGPLALVDPAVRPIWLAHVREVQSLATTLRDNPATGVGILAYPAAAVIAVLVLARDANLRRDSGFIIAAAALLTAIAMTTVAIRAAPYTMWLGVPFVAAALLHAFDRLKLTTLPARTLATIPFTPVALSFAAILLIEAIGPSPTMARDQRDDACFEVGNYAALVRLPAGLIATDVDYGTFVLALTPHSVIGAPYHRLAYGIVTSHRVFASAPDEAKKILGEARADYVMTCGSRAPKGLSETERARSLWDSLAAGMIPDWLEPIPGTGPFSVYRFKRG